MIEGKGDKELSLPVLRPGQCLKAQCASWLCRTRIGGVGNRDARSGPGESAVAEGEFALEVGEGDALLFE